MSPTTAVSRPRLARCGYRHRHGELDRRRPPLRYCCFLRLRLFEFFDEFRYFFVEFFYRTLPPKILLPIINQRSRSSAVYVAS